jgi:hypothetical protein
LTDSGSTHSDENALIEWLRDRDVYCPLCEYNIRGLTTPRCPECGQALRLSVALVEPYLRAWIALMVAVCAGAGSGVLFLFVLTSTGWPYKGVRIGLNRAIILQIVMIPVAALLVFSRRRFQQLPQHTQRILALIGIGLVSLAFAVIFKNIQ